MGMPGRTYATGNGYRYSINGQEKTPEIAPNTTTAEFWQYDTRISRRWNFDPRPNISISPNNTFQGNPIRYTDVLGDSIVDPRRTIPFNVYVVSTKRDIGSSLSYSRLKVTAEYNKENSILVEAKDLDAKAASSIIEKLGVKGFVGTMVLDYHRSDYDAMKYADKDGFYKKLAGGYSGDKTSVLLGMCWSGGAEIDAKNIFPDLTRGVSQKLDKATVYGLQTEANNVSFYLTGNFGVLNTFAYGFPHKDNWSRHERAFESEWTISRYDSRLKKYTSQEVYKMIRLDLKGEIIIKDKPKLTSTDIPFK